MRKACTPHQVMSVHELELKFSTSGAWEKSNHLGPCSPKLNIPGARTSSFGGNVTWVLEKRIAHDDSCRLAYDSWFKIDSTFFLRPRTQCRLECGDLQTKRERQTEIIGCKTTFFSEFTDSLGRHLHIHRSLTLPESEPGRGGFHLFFFRQWSVLFNFSFLQPVWRRWCLSFAGRLSAVVFFMSANDPERISSHFCQSAVGSVRFPSVGSVVTVYW